MKMMSFAIKKYVTILPRSGILGHFYYKFLYESRHTCTYTPTLYTNHSNIACIILLCTKVKNLDIRFAVRLQTLQQYFSYNRMDSCELCFTHRLAILYASVSVNTLLYYTYIVFQLLHHRLPECPQQRQC